MKLIVSKTGICRRAFIPYQFISLSFIFIAIAVYSTSLFAQGNTACTAVAVQPGSYTANGPSTGGNAVNYCSFPIAGNATNADWYKYTPPANGTITISSCSGGANTRLSLLKGFCFVSPITGLTSFGPISCVASNDDACNYSFFDLFGRASKIENVAVTGGTTYYIQWDDRWSTSGFDWSLEYTPAPTNNNPCAAMLLDCGIPMDGTTYGATVSSTTPTCTVGSHNDVFYKFPAFALSAYYIEVDGDADYDPILVVYTGTCDGTLTQLYCNNFTSGNGTMESRTFVSTDDQYIYVQTYDANNSGGGGNFTIHFNCPSRPNDECVDAYPITVNGEVLSGYNNGATPSTIPLGSCGDGISDADVWYKFTSPLSGKIIIETFNDESFDGLDDSELRILDACGGDVLFCNDDGGEGLMSRIEIPCENYTPFSLYYIQVDGYGSARGEFSISVTTEDCATPVNDECNDASELLINAPPQEATNFNATSSPDILIDCGYGGENASTNDVWFYFTAPSSGILTIQTFAGTLTDSQLQVMDACGGNVIACDEDGGDGLMSKITLPCGSYSPGDAYLVQVDGYSGSDGTFSISVTSSLCPPPNDDCTDAIMLPVNYSWTCPANQVQGTTYSASASDTDGCEETSPDVYYKFNSGSNSEVIINLISITAADLIISAFAESCSSTPLFCLSLLDEPYLMTVTPFTTYYLRIHSLTNFLTGTFNICIENIPSETITLNGTVSGWSNNCTAREIQISMLDLSLGSLSEITTTLNPDGTFTISGPELLPGPYNILAKVQGALAVLTEDVSFSAGNNFISIGPVILGDINNNNVINVLDLSIFSASFGKTAGSPGFNFLADLNCDGVINIFDVSILGAGFNQVGDDIYIPTKPEY
ncbi:hypothetical protein G3O08_14890 [Cryomorpha ignava]|uniref:T9SS-like galactose binding domain-containing protein n=1 Tax=Cryomorpha ignava TaxID=101383 RepID=A0A7K3WSX0_9FLAO|nr:dockerin type I domain-containing protein [Cryomorpha ignava]NEN24789.1 hypothetical protein [Cryomorpha ignava]